MEVGGVTRFQTSFQCLACLQIAILAPGPWRSRPRRFP
ncbi:hypothetical protein FB106_10252 [Synechococcus sp. Ace-Pa]|nr:hypothetical protein FB106_10252 [Synechococcus sp. Ace-Pa]